MFGRALHGAILGAASLVALAACGAQVPPDVPTPGLTVPPQPIVDCVAVPAERCSMALAAAEVEAPAGSVPLRIRMICSGPACTVVGGDARIDAWFSDGSVTSWETSWSSAPEIPPEPVDGAVILPVTPVCVGVELQRCQEMAATIGVPDGDPGRVVSLVVTCGVAVCGPSEGEGTTQVTYEDGTTQVADWGYEGG